MKNMLGIVAIVFIALVGFEIRSARAANGDKVKLDPQGIATLETPAAAFPAACTGANTAILAAHTRSTGILQNIGTADLCVCLAATCTATMASCPGTVLKAASVAGKGDGGTISFGNQAGRVWAGPVSCGGAANGLVTGWAY